MSVACHQQRKILPTKSRQQIHRKEFTNMISSAGKESSTDCKAPDRRVYL